jgi:hypothetical protein
MSYRDYAFNSHSFNFYNKKIKTTEADEQTWKNEKIDHRRQETFHPLPTSKRINSKKIIAINEIPPNPKTNKKQIYTYLSA